MSSLLSLGSVNGLGGAARLSAARRSASWSGKPPLSALYDLLIAPMEESLPPPPAASGSAELVIVLQVSAARPTPDTLTPYQIIYVAYSKLEP